MESDLIEKALELFGTTKDCNVGAFILPDGKMLDFSEDVESTLGRNLHSDIIQIFPEEEDVGYYESINIFMEETGAMRHHHEHNYTNLEMSIEHEPTFEQIQTIRRCACEQGLEPHVIIYDIRENEGDRSVIKSGKVEQDIYKGQKCNAIINRFMNNLLGEY